MDQEARLAQIEQFINDLKAFTTIPYEVEQAFRQRLADIAGDIPTELSDAPLAAVSAPTGGGTQDAEARSSINAIIGRLEDLGLILPN